MSESALWLLKQIDADEKYIHGPERETYSSQLQWTHDGLDGAADRVLAECAAKRVVIALMTRDSYPSDVLGALALPYNDRDGYAEVSA